MKKIPFQDVEIFLEEDVGVDLVLDEEERFFSDNKSNESSTDETIDSLSQKINSLQNALTSLKNKIEH